MKCWIFILTLVFCSCTWAGVQTDFFRASLNGNLKKVQTLLEKEGPQLIYESDKDRNTALHLACCAKKGGNKKELIQYLIDKGADVNAKNHYFSTPLLIAVSTSNYEGTEILLKAKKIEVNQGDDHTQTVLHYAVQMNDPLLLKLLLSHEKINPNFGTMDGATPLHFAAMLGCTEEAEILLDDPRTNPNAKEISSDYIGATPLHFAALQAQAKIVHMLLEKKADVHATVSDGIYAGFTPVHFAVLNPDVFQVFDTVQLLFQAGANMQCESQLGQKPENLTNVSVIKQFLENPKKDYMLKKSK